MATICFAIWFLIQFNLLSKGLKESSQKKEKHPAQNRWRDVFFQHYGDFVFNSHNQPTHRFGVFRSWRHDWRRRVVVIVVISILATWGRRRGARLARLQRQTSTGTNLRNQRTASWMCKVQSFREADELGVATHRRRVFVWKNNNTWLSVCAVSTQGS